MNSSIYYLNPVNWIRWTLAIATYPFTKTYSVAVAIFGHKAPEVIGKWKKSHHPIIIISEWKKSRPTRIDPTLREAKASLATLFASRPSLQDNKRLAYVVNGTSYSNTKISLETHLANRPVLKDNERLEHIVNGTSHTKTREQIAKLLPQRKEIRTRDLRIIAPEKRSFEPDFKPPTKWRRLAQQLREGLDARLGQGTGAGLMTLHFWHEERAAIFIQAILMGMDRRRVVFEGVPTDSPLKASINKFIQLFENELPNSIQSSGYIAFYNDRFIPKLRAIFKNEEAFNVLRNSEGITPEYRKTLEGLLDIAVLLYCGTDLFSTYESLLIDFVGEGYADMTDETIRNKIDKADASLKLGFRSTTRKMIGAANVLGAGVLAEFDPLRYGNFPCKLFEVTSGEKPVTFFRSGSPTIGRTYDPIFWAFLFRKHLLKESHLHVSLQDNSELSGGDAERNAALFKLFAQFEDFHTFVCIPQDSKPYQGKILSSNFVDIDNYLYQSILENKDAGNGSAYHVPPKLIDRSSIDKKIIICSHLVRDVFFNGSDIISLKDCPEEIRTEEYARVAKREGIHVKNLTEEMLDRYGRRIFFELFHTFFVLAMISEVEPSTAFTGCKDYMDRGMKEISRVINILGILSNQDQTHDQKRMLRVFTNAIAIWIKTQAMHGDRAKDHDMVQPRLLHFAPKLRELATKGELYDWFGISKEKGIFIVERPDLKLLAINGSPNPSSDSDD